MTILMRSANAIKPKGKRELRRPKSERAKNNIEHVKRKAVSRRAVKK